MGFAPRDELQLELCREFLRLRAAQAERLDDAASIFARALAKPASLAGKALTLFVGCYGTFAGDVALAFLARGGLYVCCGIAAKLAHRLAEGGKQPRKGRRDEGLRGATHPR